MDLVGVSQVHPQGMRPFLECPNPLFFAPHPLFWGSKSPHVSTFFLNRAECMGLLSLLSVVILSVYIIFPEKVRYFYFKRCRKVCQGLFFHFAKRIIFSENLSFFCCFFLFFRSHVCRIRSDVCRIRFHVCRIRSDVCRIRFHVCRIRFHYEICVRIS